VRRPAVSLARTRIHPSADVERGAELGDGTTVWRQAHVMSGARIGARCMIGQGCFVAGRVRIGDGCRIQNHVSIFDGVEIAEDVFIGPSAVFTNVRRPRAAYPRKPSYEKTLVGRGVTIGANATIVCGVRIGDYAFIGAGSVVTRDAPEHALVLGTPGHVVGWTCACAETVSRARTRPRRAVCDACGLGPAPPPERSAKLRLR
jgi:UDP-2-acetamido-3-amino-2,3-dideoxy-glucuronate N-acetyltransferase